MPNRKATEPTRLSADIHGTGRTVVLLHGQPGGRHDWDHVVASLDGRLRLLIPDRLGYGATGGRAASGLRGSRRPRPCLRAALAYSCVVSVLEWPSRRRTASMETPELMSSVPWAWRSW